ncbi:MAG TPA: hypothetical protein VIN67_03005 [Desulfobaccales bacterium]
MRFLGIFLLMGCLSSASAWAVGPFNYRLPQGPGRIFVEIHQDIYFKVPDMLKYAMQHLEDHNLAGRINWPKFLQAVEEQSGAPVDITRTSAPPGAAPTAGSLNLTGS